MIFNGHTHETLAQLDDVTMANIQVMYADGMLGGRALLETIGSLTAGVFNYIRPANAPSYSLAKILGNAYDYIYPPATPEQQAEQAQEALKMFMSQAPGFNQERFGNG